MPVDLTRMLEPRGCALLIMECQEGVVGSAAGLGALAEAVARHATLDRIADLVHAARTAGVPVLYLNASRRRDHLGTSANCLLLALGRKGEPMVVGSPRQAVVRQLAPAEGDFVLNRQHGLTPFHGTELDSILRNMGIRTVVAAGVSVNVGITGLTIEAVNSGYQVILPRDAVAGTPDEYVDSVFQHTLRMLATITTTKEVASVWTSHSSQGDPHA